MKLVETENIIPLTTVFMNDFAAVVSSAVSSRSMHIATPGSRRQAAQ